MAGASGSPFVAGNALEILNNGDAFYPSMLQAVRKAKASITIEAYIYWAGEIGRAFADALAAQARAGIQVKILLDAIGSAQIGGDILKILSDGGCQVAWYNPIRWFTLGRFNNRTHRKSLILDGRIAFTGGAGIADHWRGNARNPGEWRDMQIRLEGPAVVPLQTGFAHNWQQTTGELVTGDAFYPEIEPAGRLAAQTLLSSPEAGASSVRTMYYLSIVVLARIGLHRESVLHSGPRRLSSCSSRRTARRGRAHHGVRHPERQLARPTEQRASVRAAARRRDRDPGVQPDDAAPQDHGGRSELGDGRHDQLRQSIVRAQRREQRLLLPSRPRSTTAFDFSRRPDGLCAGDS